MAAANSTNHPYFPRNLHLPHYIPNDKNVLEILVIFFGLIAVLLVLTFIYAGSIKSPKFSTLAKLKLCWFTSCAFIHTILEGYFSVFHSVIAGQMFYLAQVWKEYSKGDSRYMSSDTFTVCMESITAFVDGPLALLAFVAFIKNKPYRYLIQLIVSLCQLYGDVLYFMTEIKEGFSHGEMWHPVYFWFYFVFMNALWIVIPAILIVEAFVKLSSTQALADSNKKEQ